MIVSLLILFTTYWIFFNFTKKILYKIRVYRGSANWEGEDLGNETTVILFYIIYPSILFLILFISIIKHIYFFLKKNSASSE
jgi:hypothetical protein